MHLPIKIIAILLGILIIVSIAATLGVYTYFRLSLPDLDGEIKTADVTAKVTIERDILGTAIITASNRLDAAYALGFAHGQDRYFQMDLMRRSAAGELSEIVGSVALNVDKAHRFHQFRKRAQSIYQSLPENQRKLLQHYTKGVNDAFSALIVPPFEYSLTNSSPQPWLPEDSLLVSFSMYLDLQHDQVKRDLALTEVGRVFGPAMVDFLVQPSRYQAALDGSEIPLSSGKIPALQGAENLQGVEEESSYLPIEEPLDIGSNNWAVTGDLTATGRAMLAGDMHLSLRVPIIWYRAQLNYADKGNMHRVTGVSLPGTPVVVVGSNGYVAWAFTNANIDNVDWITLDSDTNTTTITEVIRTRSGEEQFEIEMSSYGPVKTVAGQKYALAWVAHQSYAVDLGLVDLEQVHSVEEGVAAAETFGIPVQNMILADAQGNIAWKLAGAVTARPIPSFTAIEESQYSAQWTQDDPSTPFALNPSHGRLWTGNSRVISAGDLPRYGDGGYALGARATQIRDRLFEEKQFDEQTFYRIQLDNEARFLTAWHQLLVSALQDTSGNYSRDLSALHNWGRCACPESIGYTLVRRFRSTVIDRLMAPIEHHLQHHGLSLSPVFRHLEPAVWQLLKQQPGDWLPNNQATWQAFLESAYVAARQNLADEFQNGNTSTLAGLAWGKVNALQVKHPFSGQIPIAAPLLNMPIYPGFGDSYMPALQKPETGASQRLFVQPGLEQQAILTVPGGQSSHPLSKYYKAGFNDYAENQSTPLLPGKVEHRIVLLPN